VHAAQSLAASGPAPDIAGAEGRLQGEEEDSLDKNAVRGAAPLGLLVGITVGVLWTLLALGALASAAAGARASRPDWVLGWTLVGVLLLGAGLSALIGSWLHHRAATHH
jgi:hypothetical protein